ncbi:hypothetical protein HHK36_030309 [Tetracentron sinense]|uniref:Uncharacterized protein n=1 Tax=Tetracentron sinense TaxID=13715 RepID=A0A834Y975_TETSI|nr:hypothetical protein HHK36_030309 [Tetracentron sinense]
MMYNSIYQFTSSTYCSDVSNNSPTGSIPQNIGNCIGFQVLYTYHLIIGLDFLKMHSWVNLESFIPMIGRDLSYNLLTGEIPFNIGFLQVATLSLQGNQLSGKILSVIGLMQALAVLNLTYTEKLKNGSIFYFSNHLSTLCINFWLECLGCCKSLHGNKLTGSIPLELRNMTKLHYLELNDNHLCGHIPPELGKLTDLFDLNVANNNLEGCIPDNLSSCTNLNSLDISNNRITGSIPSSLGDLEHLLKLNLRKNRLFGYIPAEFGNLRSLMEIDISNNGLSGPIPQELGQLQNWSPCKFL